MYALPNVGPSFGLLPRPTSNGRCAPSRSIDDSVTTSPGVWLWMLRHELLAATSTGCAVERDHDDRRARRPGVLRRAAGDHRG